jgi:cobalt/nickel transport system permease protein
VVDIPIGRLAAAMIGWHILIGIGECAITAAVLGAVVATRPDLVYAARHLQADLVLIDDEGRTVTVAPDRAVAAKPAGRDFGVGIAVTLLVAGVLSLFASAHPDGLQFVGRKLGFGGAATPSASAGSPLADYGVSGISNGHISGALAGVIGALVTIALGLVVAKLSGLRRSRNAARAESGAEASRV